MRKKEKTVTRSFRISESVFKGLEQDASNRRISVNTLVNQLFVRHVDFDRFFDQVGAIRLSRPTLSRILNACPDDAISEVARLSGKDTPKAIIHSKYGVFSLTTVLDYIRIMIVNGGYAEYNEVESQGKRTITLIHNMGQKWSILMRHYFESLFELVGHQSKITSSENSVTIEI